MSARIWPSMTDYAGAVQSPETSFRLPALAGAEFATMAPLGLPAVASGQNAVVFTASIGQTRTAVRCFTTEPSDGRHRYQSLERHLSGHPVPAMAQASWVGDAVEVNGHLWPVVTMEWVEGDQLHSHVEDHRHDGGALEGLTEQWVATCEELRQAGVAHGDLQHGNVIVEPSGRTRLIDFDGIWVADMAASPPSEVGHPNYQHPGRKDNGAWGWSIDWFSALSVFVSLRALAADPSLWDHHMGENLIFTESDFWGDAQIWGRLERSPDRDVRNWSQLLAEACAHEPDAPYELATILERGLVAVEAPATPAPAGADAADPGPVAEGGSQWWVTSEGVVESEPTEPAPPQVTPPAQPSGDTNDWDWGATAPAPEPAEPAPSPTGPPVRPPTRQRPEQQEVRSSWDAAADPGQVRPASASEPGRGGWTRWAVPAAAVAVVLAVVAGAVAWISTSSDDADDLAGGSLPFRVVEGSPVNVPDVPDLVIDGHSSQFAFGSDVQGTADIIVIDRSTREEVGRLPTGGGIVLDVLDRGAEVWLTVAGEENDNIIVFDPACVCVSREVQVTDTYVFFLFEHEGRVWVGEFDRSIGRYVVSVIDPPTGQIVARFPVEDAVATADHLSPPVLIGDLIWIADIERVWIIDPASLTVTGHVDLDGFSYLTVLGHVGSVFVTDQGQGFIGAVDPADLSVQRVEIADPRDDGQLVISEPVVDDRPGLIWVSSFDATGTLFALDPVNLEVVHRIALDGPLGPPEISNGFVWVPVGGHLVVVNPETGAIVVELPGVGPEEPFDFHVVDNTMWLLPWDLVPARTYLLEDT